MPETFLRGAVIGLVVALVAVLAGVVFRKPIVCSQCQTPQKKLRAPKSLHQAMWGGFICPNCGADLNAKGELRKKD